MSSPLYEVPVEMTIVYTLSLVDVSVRFTQTEHLNMTLGP